VLTTWFAYAMVSHRNKGERKMEYTVGQTVRTIYGIKEIVKVNKNTVLVPGQFSATIKIEKKHLDILNTK
jgi:hypothetical protein